MKKLPERLYRTSATVFRTSDIALLLEEADSKRLKSKVCYYVKKGVLKRLRRGIYTKPNYNSLELANKIYTPSYVSLETVLAKEGVIFQYYKTIFAISYLTRKVNIDGNEIQIRKIKNSILLNTLGITQKENYFIATRERAFLDALYLYKNYYFDNLDILDKKKVFEILKIYQNKALEQRARKLL